MSVPLILTLLAGAATFIGAFLGVLGQKPSNRLLAFSLGFAAGIMLLISLMVCRLFWAMACLSLDCWVILRLTVFFLTRTRRI